MCIKILIQEFNHGSIFGFNGKGQWLNCCGRIYLYFSLFIFLFQFYIGMYFSMMMQVRNILKWSVFIVKGNTIVTSLHSKQNWLKYHQIIYEILVLENFILRGTTPMRTILIFLTGFYVTQVLSRYWNQFTSLPWPDR